MNDPYNLQRFVNAQMSVYEQVERELKTGRKTSHWMWFVFPQINGLGFSEIARHFAISSLGEAEAYLDHPVLGNRLIKATEIVIQIEGRSAHVIFGSPDDLKFRSSMTLFSCAANAPPCFASALGKYFENKPDEKTLALLK